MQGTQFGHHNVQINLFVGKQPRGPVVAGEVPQAPLAFQPRENLVTELRAGIPDVSVVRAVTGMRGVGKTQLAAAYARQCREAGWRLVAWVNAEGTVGILSGLAVVADRLGIVKSGKTLETIGAEVRNRLEADGERCLIVFDNVTDFELVRPFTPALGAPQVILTSAEAIAVGSRQPIQVGVFNEEEALAYLAERTGRNEPDGARALAEELGYLPLALAQAAAVIATQHLPYTRYLARLRGHPAQKYLPPVKGDPYPRGVAEAILLSADVVTTRDPAGLCREVLGIVSLLSAEGVSREILYHSESAGVWTVDAETIDEALAQLADASLLTFVGDEGVIAHRVVMRVLREQATRDGTLPTLAAKATKLLNAYRKSLGEYDELWQRQLETRECVRQVIALADHLAPLRSEAESEAVLALRVWALESVIKLGDSPAQAVELGERLVPVCERALGKSHPDTLSVRHDLAGSYQIAGRPSEAVPLMEAVVADYERTLGASHPDTLISREDLAFAYQATGRLDEAVPLYEAVLTDFERVRGKSHPDTLMSRNNLAFAYQAVGRLNEAIPLFEAVLADTARVRGTLHPDTLISRSNVASLYRATGRLDQAVPLLEAVVADSTRVLGVSHPDTLAYRHNLARAYQAAGRLDEALPLYEAVLGDFERVLGKSHPNTLTSLSHLAGAYRDEGNLAKAVTLFEQALAGMETVLGVEHPTTIQVRQDLASARQDVNQQADDPARRG